jgi:hypothetical protein
MEAQNPLIVRVQTAMGPAAATIFAERDTDDHYSATARQVPVPWDAYAQVSSKGLAGHLQMFLITMAFGRAAAPPTPAHAL